MLKDEVIVILQAGTIIEIYGIPVVLKNDTEIVSDFKDISKLSEKYKSEKHQNIQNITHFQVLQERMFL